MTPMQHKASVRWCLILVVSSLVWLAARAAGAFPEGPPDGVAGDPPLFFNCTLCHDSFAVNSGNGSLELLGLPLDYTPGAQYDLTVRLADPGQVEWGFEITALDAAGAAAGSFTITDALQTQLSDNPGTNPDYVKHTLDGVHEGTPNGPVTWGFRWTAPLSGAVTFYLAGNAADGSGDPSGDYIYALTRTVTEPTVAVTAKTWSGVKELYRRR
jgi:hypothetical protein